jgi:hypothetical protein
MKPPRIAESKVTAKHSFAVTRRSERGGFQTGGFPRNARAAIATMNSTMKTMNRI